MFEDKTIICKDCQGEFIFTAGEQEFYQEKGFENEPQRCLECRKAFKQQLRANRVMHEGVCSSCGGAAKVPFQPTQDKPIYCSDCYEKMRNNCS